jgi:hypothetical protein
MRARSRTGGKAPHDALSEVMLVGFDPPPHCSQNKNKSASGWSHRYEPSPQRYITFRCPIAKWQVRLVIDSVCRTVTCALGV